MDFQIEELPPYRLAYMRQEGPYGPSNDALMERFKSWAQAQGLLTPSSVLLGIVQDDPATTAPERCRYDVGIVTEHQFEDEQVQQAILAGGRYAVFTLAHTAQAMQAAWRNMFPLLAANGYPIDPSRPILERYRSQMLDNHLCELCVPV